MTQPTPKTTDGPLATFRKLVNLYTRLPCSPSDPLKTLLNNALFGDYLLAQNEKLMEHWYFRPASSHKKRLQQGIMSRLQAPLASFARWIALVGMGICEAFLTEDLSQVQLQYLWIKHIEGTLRHELLHDTTSDKIQERRSDWVHISLLKTMVLHSSNTYQLLRSITPTFLQLVYSDPTLWPRDCNPTCVPLSKILCSEAHELAYFAYIDCACAMTLGLPQQLEYDTTPYPWLSDDSSHLWAHGSPAEFQLVLADINACRDKSPQSRHWRDIEKWLVEWHSQPAQHMFTESWMTVAWYAVQESWRLALLAYLYMAVCNASSDDSRIQTCVKQILQVVGTVKKRKSSGAEVSFLIQYLIVGICGRSEVHRAMVRQVLAGNKDTRFWILRGSDFVPVLDHLWHGAGAGGRPVTWSDYMYSRATMLPVVV